MALDAINRAVLEAAQKEAARIADAARAAAENRVRAARAAAEEEGERRCQAAFRAVDEECSRRLISARGAQGKELLAERNRRMDGVFAAARAAVLALPPADYQEAMAALLRQAAGAGAGMVRIHPDDRDLFLRVLMDVNRDRALDAQLKVDDAAPLRERGGFVFVGGAYQVDQTLDTLLAELQRELAPGIAAALFGA